MRPDDRVRLRHIADALSAAIRFTEGRSREDLDKDEMLAFALVHAILIVGEAAGKVTAELRDQHPQVPWALITGMRNQLVHAYFDINHDILWTTATESVPELLAQVDRLLSLD
jgi:uncharacterized protein with HEPN domain